MELILHKAYVVIDTVDRKEDQQHKAHDQTKVGQRAFDRLKESNDCV